jgi:hypothetical protein
MMHLTKDFSMKQNTNIKLFPILLFSLLLLASNTLKATLIVSNATGNWSASGSWVAQNVNRTGTLNAVKQGMCVQSAHAAQQGQKLAGGNQSPGIENEGNFMTFPMEQKNNNLMTQ